MQHCQSREVSNQVRQQRGGFTLHHTIQIPTQSNLSLYTILRVIQCLLQSHTVSLVTQMNQNSPNPCLLIWCTFHSIILPHPRSIATFVPPRAEGTRNLREASSSGKDGHTSTPSKMLNGPLSDFSLATPNFFPGFHLENH